MDVRMALDETLAVLAAFTLTMTAFDSAGRWRPVDVGIAPRLSHNSMSAARAMTSHLYRDDDDACAPYAPTPRVMVWSMKVVLSDAAVGTGAATGQ